MDAWQPSPEPGASTQPDPTPTQPLPPVMELPVQIARPWWTVPIDGPFDSPVNRTINPPNPPRRLLRSVANQAGRRRAWVVLGVLGGSGLLATAGVALTFPNPPGPSHAVSVPSRSGPTAASRSSRSALPAASPTPTSPPGVPADLATLPAPDAVARLQEAGVSIDGIVESAWTWSDSSGTHLLATTRATSGDQQDQPSSVTLRVALLSGLDGHPTVDRRLRDPGLHCSHDQVLTADFTPGTLAVRDLDGDGTAEVMLGWTARCGDDTEPSRIRLALMSRSRLFVLRAQGVLPDAAAAPASVEPTPAPDSGNWPAPFLTAAMDAFNATFTQG